MTKFAIITGLSVLTITWNGFVLSVLWTWFMVPAFAVKPLSVPYAIGVALIADMLTMKTRKPEDAPETGYVVLCGLAMPLILLGIGFIVRLFA